MILSYSVARSWLANRGSGRRRQIARSWLACCGHGGYRGRTARPWLARRGSGWYLRGRSLPARSPSSWAKGGTADRGGARVQGSLSAELTYSQLRAPKKGQATRGPSGSCTPPAAHVTPCPGARRHVPKRPGPAITPPASGARTSALPACHWLWRGARWRHGDPCGTGARFARTGVRRGRTCHECVPPP